MDESRWQRLGSDHLARRLAAQPPLTPGEVRKIRSLYLLYPVAAVILITTIGVSLGRVVGASLFYLCWLGVHFLTLSAARRRQVMGLAPAS